ncbi:MAG TPA: hypothetical protein VHA33_11620 [Candidatus Angelobacter sp.]|jgi:hypothetical protein|nr:hypothetical protein [Candidatus Angelobacter sp.]
MAVLKFNSEEKLHAYAVLARVNHSFRNIVANLYDLEKDNVFDVASLGTFRGFTKELQSLLNYKLLSTLQDVEEKQAFQFGKVRIEREHYLNADRPAFRQRNRRKE